MAILESLLRRLGYIKLTTYGFVLTPDNRVLPMLAEAPLPPQWQPQDCLSAPLLPAMVVPVLGLPPAPPPSIPSLVRPAAPPTPPRPPSPAPTDEEEWEWQMAMARARAQAEPATPAPPARAARGTNPPPMARRVEGTPPPVRKPDPITERTPVAGPPTPRLKRPTGPPPGIGRRLHSAIKTPGLRAGAAPRPAPTDRTHRDLKKVDRPALRTIPRTPPVLPDPDTVVTQAAPSSFTRRPAAATLPSLTKRLAASG